jgi:segregation and condensation protein B
MERMGKRERNKESVSEPAIKPQAGRRPRVLRVDNVPEAEPVVDDSGLSLEDLGQAYAALLNRGAVPYEEPTVPNATGEESVNVDDPVSDPLAQLNEAEPVAPADEPCALSPQSILEAMLFVGHPQNEPLTARQVASLMRGVLPEEIDEFVRELNAQYEAEKAPYTIVSAGAGYRLALREEYATLHEQFHGRVREARLSQAAIDTLAIVAYHQPVGVKQIDDFRGKSSGAILSQLVRRQLVKIERSPSKPREALYTTTARFLDLFGLESLDDLPRSAEFE